MPKNKELTNTTQYEEIIATHEGWILFCPCWFRLEPGDGLTPVPKFKLYWLLDLAISLQCVYIYLWSFFNLQLNFAVKMRELKEPATIQVKSQEEQK